MSTSSADIKITEARTAVLLRNANSYTNPNEATIWLLEHLFRPLTTINYDVSIYSSEYAFLFSFSFPIFSNNML